MSQHTTADRILIVMVNGDENLLQIVVANLVGNAWNFSGKVAHSRIELGTIDREGVRFCFVRDNGAGFDPSRARKVFTAFQHLHSAEELEGTGIGLAVVHRIIDRHGGKLWVESRVGTGTTFSFSV